MSHLSGCRGCKRLNRRLQYCDYNSQTGRLRTVDGGRIGPNGGCKLYEPLPGYAPVSPTAVKCGLGIDDMYLKIKNLYNEGYTDNDISRELHCNPKTVRKWRKRNGLKSNYTLSLQHAGSHIP